VVFGEGYVEGGRLTDRFFQRIRLPQGMERSLREWAKWSECDTFTFVFDPQTINTTVTVIDLRLDLETKRRCLLQSLVNAFGFRVDPSHARQLELFFPRYISLAHAASKCGRESAYEQVVSCIVEEFRTL